jgi:hypothetical protein
MHARQPPAVAPPRYEGPGWIQWPDHREQSLQFLRTLGAAQQGAASVSECFLAASRIDPADPESWYREWQRLGGLNARRADLALAAGNRNTAMSNFLRAGGYYRASECYLAPADARRPETFARVLASSKAYLGLISPAGEILSIDLGDGTSLDAYFLKPGDGRERWPTVIGFGGLDGYKDELLPRMSRHALSRGMALLLVDMPGQGGALRLRGTPNRPDSEVAVARCIDFLLERPDVDGDRIALYGASLGGIYSARAASRERRIKAVVSDSLVFDLHASLAARLAQSDPSTWKFLEWVFGCNTPADVVEKSRHFRMADFIGSIRCPYLIVQGEHDFLGLQTARDALECAKSHGVPAELRVFSGDETGASHCQADNPNIGQEFICDWLAGHLGTTQT